MSRRAVKLIVVYRHQLLGHHQGLRCSLIQVYRYHHHVDRHKENELNHHQDY